MRLHSPQPLKKITVGGFSLIELLTVIAVIVVAGVLGLGVMKGLRESAMQTSCTARLKQIGIATQLHINENSQRLLLYSLTPATGQSPAKETIWIDTVKPFGIEGEATRCPSIPTSKTNGYIAYGRRSVEDFAKDLKDSKYQGASKGGEVWFLPRRVESPGSYWLFADSLSSLESQYANLRGEQTYSIRPNGAAAGTGVQIRHSKKANVLFADGHLEACDTTRLKEIGFISGYDPNKQPAYW